MNISPVIFALLLALAAFGFASALSAFLILFASLFTARKADEQERKLRERAWGWTDLDDDAFRACVSRRGVGR